MWGWEADRSQGCLGDAPLSGTGGRRGATEEMGLRKEEQPGWCRKGMGGWAFSPHQAEDPLQMVLVISVQPAPASLVSSPPCVCPVLHLP